MLISVIVTCKGRLRFLEETAPRLIGLPELEYVLVDWDCPERSGKWLESRYPEAVVVHVPDQPVFDVSAARNAGAFVASGELLAFTDVDMKYTPSFADQIREEWEPGSVLLFGDREGDCGFITIHRDDFLRAGGYDRRYTGYGYEDHELRKCCDVLGLESKRLFQMKRAHIHHSNDDRVAFFEEKDKRISQRVNLDRLQNEPFRLYHGDMLEFAAKLDGGRDRLPDCENLASLARIVSWKAAERVLLMHGTDQEAAELETVNRTSRIDTSTHDANRVSYDIVCVQGERCPEMLSADTYRALDLVSDEGTIAWFGYGDGNPALEQLVNQIADQAVFLVEGTTLGFIQLNPAIRARLRQAVRVFEADRAEPGQEQATVPSITYDASRPAARTRPLGRPLVSALISLYRSDRFIDSFLGRLERQTLFEHAELVFVVNSDEACPGDEVLKRVDAFEARHKQVIPVRKEGIYASWNRGIRAASADLLCNLNHDDFHYDNALELMVTALTQFEHVDLCYGLTSYVAYELSEAELDRRNARRRSVIDCEEVRARHRVECCPMWRRSIHDAVGLFDESFEAAGDHEMWVRMLERGLTFLQLEEPTSIFYRHPDSLTARHKGSAEIERIFARYGEKYR